MEVPLEANLSARRAGKREHAEEVGHLQRLSRGSARAIVGQAGIAGRGRARGRLAAARHSASSRGRRGQNVAAVGKWGARRGLHLLAPPLGEAPVHSALRVPVHTTPPLDFRTGCPAK